jgi:hypothetical protein
MPAGLMTTMKSTPVCRCVRRVAGSSAAVGSRPANSPDRAASTAAAVPAAVSSATAASCSSRTLMAMLSREPGGRWRHAGRDIASV